jgi:hypothetical protein
MRLLLDECVTRYLKRDLVGHEVVTLKEAGFNGLKNGVLLRSAAGKYDVLITVDQNIPFQQNLKELEISVLIIIARNKTYAALKPLTSQILKALETIQHGEIVNVK